MRPSAVRAAANRANAARGKATSSRNALTLLALATPTHENSSSQNAQPDVTGTAVPVRCHPTAVLHGACGATPAHENDLATRDRSRPVRCHATAVAGPNTPIFVPVGGPYLDAFTDQFQPEGPIETLLVRRLAALALRIDRLNAALAALPSLGERRALIDHLTERYAIDDTACQVPAQPDWHGPLHRYDDPSYVNPNPGEVLDNPALDPDPAACAAVYTLSSRRAEIFSRLEAVAGNAFTNTLIQLRTEQAVRRRNIRYPANDRTAEAARHTVTGHRPSSSPNPLPNAQNSTVDRNEPSSARTGSENEPTAPSQIGGNEATAPIPAVSPNPTAALRSTGANPVAQAASAHHPRSSRRQRRKHHR